MNHIVAHNEFGMSRLESGRCWLAAENAGPPWTLSMCVRPPLGLGTDPSREAQKLHPVRNAWIAVVHLCSVHKRRARDAGPKRLGAWRVTTVRGETRDGTIIQFTQIVIARSMVRRSEPCVYPSNLVAEAARRSGALANEPNRFCCQANPEVALADISLLRRYRTLKNVDAPYHQAQTTGRRAYRWP